jgi:hypothetical protein
VIFTNNPEVMRMKLYRLLALGLLALLLVACGKEEGAGEAGEPMSAKEVEKKTDKPDDALTAGVDALKENNLLGFMQTILPPASLDKLREEFEKSKSEMPPTEEQKAEFASTMDMLTREGAEDEMMAMLEPQLVQMSAQMPMMMGFAQMGAQQAVMENPDLSPEQKEMAQESMTAAFTKLQGINFGDVELARQAVDTVVATARSLELTSMDQVQALDFDAMMGKAGMVMGGVKGVLDVYGISVDEMLGSVATEVVSEEGDTATVAVKYSVFGSEQETETTMTNVDGRWYSADLIEQIEMADDLTDALDGTPEVEPAG